LGCGEGKRKRERKGRAGLKKGEREEGKIEGCFENLNFF
jgi:hypothetical protein